MTKYIHCAFVMHVKGEKTFLFSVGREEKIRGGTKVVCDTRFGKKTARCSETVSFYPRMR